MSTDIIKNFMPNFTHPLTPSQEGELHSTCYVNQLQHSWINQYCLHFDSFPPILASLRVLTQPLPLGQLTSRMSESNFRHDQIKPASKLVCTRIYLYPDRILSFKNSIQFFSDSIHQLVGFVAIIPRETQLFGFFQVYYCRLETLQGNIYKGLIFIGI